MLRLPRVLLADDHRMLVDALKGILEPRCEVVGAVGDGRALLEAAAKLQPDIIVLDIAMPRLNGLDAARHLKRTLPKIKLIFMTMNEDPDLVGEAFRAGAVGISAEEGGGVRIDGRDRKSVEGWFLCDAQCRGRAGEYFPAGAQSPRSCRRTHAATAGSYSTFGGGAFHERGRLRPANHETDRCGTQVRGHGPFATEE